MKAILRLATFFLLIIIISSCSTSRKSVTYRKSERKSTRIKANPESREYAKMRDEVVLQAIQHIGRDYRYGGKKPSTGFDCSGFVSYVFNKAGLKVHGASHQQARLGSEKPRSELEAGDLIFFGKGKKVSHVAIVVKNKGGDLEVIHSTSSSGVRIDEISRSSYWNKRYLFSRDVIFEEHRYVTGQ